jgi:hypothetical protein
MTPQVVRRTFAALAHPVGSAERARLNADARTSEYMPSYRYVVVEGTHRTTFRTKTEADAYARGRLQKDTTRG